MSAEMYLYYPLKDRLYVDLLCDDINQNVVGACAGALNDHLITPHPLPHVKITVSEPEALLKWIQPKLQQCSLLYFKQQSCWLGRELQMDTSELF